MKKLLLMVVLAGIVGLGVYQVTVQAGGDACVACSGCAQQRCQAAAGDCQRAEECKPCVDCSGCAAAADCPDAADCPGCPLREQIRQGCCPGR